MFKFLIGSGQEFGIMQGLILVIFFGFFVGVIVWAIFAKKKYIKHMSELPLKDKNSQ